MRLIEPPKLMGQWPPDLAGRCFEEGLSADEYMEKSQRLVLDTVERREATPDHQREYSYYIGLTFKYGKEKCTSTIQIKRDQIFLDQLFAKLLKVKGKSIREISILHWEDI